MSSSVPDKVAVTTSERYPTRSMALFGFLLGMTVAPWQALADAPAFYADQITTANSQRIPPGGLDAIGGIGDWFLTDGTLCAIVSDSAHTTYLSLHGGVLVDLWHCERANDQWSSMHQQYNLQKEEIPATRKIAAEFSVHRAQLQTTAILNGVETRTRYSFDAARPGQLNIQTTIRRTVEGAPLHLYGSLILHPDGALMPFTIDSASQEFTRGFQQPLIDTSDIMSIVSSAAPADLQVLVGSRHIKPPISYGVKINASRHFSADGEERPLHTFLMGGQFFSLFGLFSSPLPSWWSRDTGLISFAASRLMDLDAGENIVIDQSILVGDRADAASITDRVYRGHEVFGRVDTDEAGIAVTDSQGRSLTFVRPEPDGAFRFRLPDGIDAITMEVTTPWSITETNVAAGKLINDAGSLDTGVVATVNLPQGVPMSLIFQPMSGDRPTEPLVFLDELTGATEGGKPALTGAASHRISLSGSVHDLRSVQLPPGSYRVIASRGVEYTVTEAHIELQADTTHDLVIEAPARAVETRGLISADFHVHSGVSFDSSLKPQQRIIDFVAQGAEVLVATEHNITYDIQPVIEAMELQQLLVSFPGVELSGMIPTAAAPTTIGHSNVFPVTPIAHAFMGGTLPFEGLRLGQVIAAYKAKHPNSIFQLNHPRERPADNELSYLNHLSIGKFFDHVQPLNAAPNASLLEVLPNSQYRDIDFDAIELLNGKDMEGYKITRGDWFALLQQNIYKVATANSDSHTSHHLVALPRNMVGTDSDHPSIINSATLVSAITAGHLYGTTGPLMRVALGGVPPGGTYIGNNAMLDVNIQSAPWVEVDTLHVWVNGQLQQTLPIETGDDLKIAIAVDTDSFVFVEVSGPVSETYRSIAPGFQPFAFANPIFIDVDGQGWNYGK